MGVLIGFICFLYLNIFFVSIVDYCGQRTSAGIALSIAAKSANVYILFLPTAEWDYTRAPEKMDGGMKP